MNHAPGAGSAPDPSRIMALSTAFWDAQTLLTANRIGLFAALDEGASELPALCDRLGTRPRPTRLLLNACVALGLVAQSERGYVNSATAAAFLVPGRPGFLGNAIRYSDNLYATWGALETALRSDAPQMAPALYLGGEQQFTRDFVFGMHDRARGIAAALVDLVDLSSRHRMLDVGGGPGTYSTLFAQRFAELHSCVLDLPGVLEHAREIIASSGVADRVTVMPGDYTAISFPSGFDVVLISGVFHRESESGCRELIAKSAECLLPGGILVVSDVFTDAGGASPLFATLFGLNMMLTAQEGTVHADADVAGWLREADFEVSRIEPLPPPMPHRVITAVKG